MKDFKDQVAFITAGAKVVIADVRAPAVEKALAALKADGIAAHGIVLDITDRAAYARAADEVEKVFGGPPTLLFNTAGVNSFGPVENSTYDDFDWLIGVNLGGVINGMVTFVPRMIKAGKPAHIVTVSSLGGLQGSALAAPYSAAKAAVINLMEGYRMSLEKHGIGVSVLCPANIKSNIAEAVRIRPAKFANTGYVETQEAIDSLHSIYIHGMEPVELAGHVKRAVEANQLYIIPYPEAKDGLKKHFDAILDSVLPMEADPEGAKKRVAALQAWAADRARVFNKEQGK